MIETAVFSYWNNIGLENTSGFNDFKSYIYSQTLAIECARKHFKTVKFVTNDFGKQQLEKIGLYKLVDEIDTSLNEFNNLEKYFWALGKIKAYSLQTEPFVHIDNDFFLWDLPKGLVECEFGFQSPEVFDDEFYRYYYGLSQIFENAPYKPQIICDNHVLTAHNCGVMATSRLDIVKEWYKIASDYIEKNKSHLLNYKPDYKIHQGLFFEQYFIASLLKAHKIDKPFYFFKDNNIKEASKQGQRFTHLWGTIKRNNRILEKVKVKVKSSQPEISERIESFY